MLRCDISVIAFILTLASAVALDLCSDTHKGPCKRSSQCELLATPGNSTHLKVNWENVLEEGCEDNHIQNMAIETLENTTTGTKTIVNLSQKETFVRANPCLQHIIHVKMIMTQTYSDTYGRSFLATPAMMYNKIEVRNEKYPFGGLLNVTAVPKICLKENGTIVIPSPPEALKNCDITSGGVKSGDLSDSDFDKVGATGTVKFTFKSPQNASTRSYKNYIVKDIQACTIAISLKESAPGFGAITIAIVSASGSVLLLLALLICLILVCCRRQKEKNMVKVDRNNDYGYYYSPEGEHLDEGRVEMVDTNDYYQ